MSPPRSLTAAAPSTRENGLPRSSASSRALRFSAPPSSRQATPPPPRARSRGRSGSRARGAHEPRILATLADARRAAGERSGARALLAEARESVERGRGWRLSACDVELAWVRLLASEPVPDRPAVESALESVETLAADLGADPYRRMAELERARLAQTVSSTPR